MAAPRSFIRTSSGSSAKKRALVICPEVDQFLFAEFLRRDAGAQRPARDQGPCVNQHKGEKVVIRQALTYHDVISVHIP